MRAWRRRSSASALQAAEQQERLLAALARGLEQVGTIVRQAAAGAPAEGAEAMAETLRWGCERISAAIAVGPTVGAPPPAGGEAVAQQLRAHRPASGRAAGAPARRPLRRHRAPRRRAQRARRPEAGAPAGELAEVVRQGFAALREALAQRGAASAQVLEAPAPGDGLSARQLTAADLAELVAAPAGPPGTVSEHETTRFFHGVSTRTDKPAVHAALDQPPARPAAIIDTGRVRQLVAAEGGQQITDRQGSNEPVTIYDPEQVRLQVVAEVNRMLAERQAGAPAPAPAPAIKESELGKLLVLMLPGALVEEPVRRALFSLICLEAVSNPGALGELSGLRSFLRRELALAAEDLARDAQPA